MLNLNKQVMIYALNGIKSELGIEVFANEEAFASAIKDFLPDFDSSEERNALVVAVKNGIGKIFLQAISEQNNAQNRQVLSNVIEKLAKECKFNYYHACMIAEAFASVFELQQGVSESNHSLKHHLYYNLNKIFVEIWSKKVYRVLVILLAALGLVSMSYYYFIFPRCQLQLSVKNAKDTTALVLLNGKVIHKTYFNGTTVIRVPLNKELLVKFLADGYEENVNKLYTDSKAKNLTVSLTHLPANLVVRLKNDKLLSDPKIKIDCEGRTIVNNEKLAVDGNTKFKVPVNKKLKISITALGFANYENSATIASSESEKELPITLLRNKGIISVDILGSNLQDSIPVVHLIKNGKEINSKSYTDGQDVKFDVSLNETYLVKVSSNLHTISQKKISITSKKPDYKVSFYLQLNPILRIFTNPEASVFLNNKLIGKADSNGNFVVKNGLGATNTTCKIACKLDSFISRTSKVRLKHGDNNHVNLILCKKNNGIITQKTKANGASLAEINSEEQPFNSVYNDYTDSDEASDHEIKDADYYYIAGSGCLSSGKVSEAVDCYKRAADLGHMEAQLDLATIYYNGMDEIPKNSSEAFKYFSKAAEQNSSEAQFMLGSCYENGYGVGKNLNKAIEWYRKASEQGVEEATDRLRELEKEV